MQHILIVGSNGVGKSTLIRKLISGLSVPVYGMITKKEDEGADGFCPVYIHRYGEPHRFSTENLVGKCKSGCSTAFPDAFDRFADKLVFPDNGVIVLDELGFLERNSPVFTNAILRLFDQAPLLIAAVRDKSTPFLDAVRAHPRAVCYPINAENRDALTAQLLKETDIFRQ